MTDAEAYVSAALGRGGRGSGPNKEGDMPTLLARNAEVLVIMDDERREIPGGGVFARDVGG